MKHRIVVCGTGTEIGKTHVACALVAHLAAAGKTVVGLKPIESGVGPSSASAAVPPRADVTSAAADARTTNDPSATTPTALPSQAPACSEVMTDSLVLARASGKVDPGACYAFRDPVSPHLAARREGRSIELETIAAWVGARDADWQIVETAGGLLSPLSTDLTNLDLALALEPTAVVLCAPDRLGVLHDVAAALLALNLANLADRTVVALSAPPLGDDSTGSNAAELETLGRAERPAAFPRAASHAAESEQAAAFLAARLLEVEQLG